MKYPWTAIPESAIPRAANPVFQHMLETYVSESNKVASTWKQFTDADLAYKPHPRSSTVGDVLGASVAFRTAVLRRVSGHAGTGAGPGPSRRAHG